MSKVNGKIIIHAASGAGINAVSSFIKSLDELKPDIADIEVNYLDISESNITDEDRDYFYRIKADAHSGDEKHGSGGNRAENIKIIEESIYKYLDSKNFTSKKSNEIHIVIGSASGGTGSSIVTFITKQFIEKGIPVIPFLIIDDYEARYASNSYKVLSTFSALSEYHDVPLSLMLADNREIAFKNPANDKTLSYESRKTSCNKSIANSIIILARMFYGNNTDIDFEDMYSMINQDKANLNIPSGLYLLASIKGTEMYDAYKDKVVSLRTLYFINKEGVIDDMDVKAVNYKRGFTDKPIDKITKTNSISLYTVHSVINNVFTSLGKTIDENNKRIEEIKASKLDVKQELFKKPEKSNAEAKDKGSFDVIL